MFDRRQFLVAGSAGIAATAFAPRMAFARAAGDQRFVFIIQRGAADGLGTIAPVGDPDFVRQRGDLAADFHDAPRLDGMFALHPAMTGTLGLYKSGQALFVHATGTPYHDRSHFDGQNVLETGGTGAYQVKDGWMNRLLNVVPEGEAKAIAISATVPAALRGANPNVTSYAPSSLPQASDDLLARVTMMYQGDHQLHGLWSEALGTRQLTSDLGANNGQNAEKDGELAAKMLADNGARIAMIETGGWDTHAGQRGRLAAQLKGLDAMIAGLQKGLGPAWSNTMVLVATEFGRTVAVNGTGGTDHGTGSAAMLLGGAVKGGRVLADWPGLAQAKLFENRDLHATTPLDAVIAGAAAEHFGVEPARLTRTLFAEAGTNKPLLGLARLA